MLSFADALALNLWIPIGLTAAALTGGALLYAVAWVQDRRRVPVAPRVDVPVEIRAAQGFHAPFALRVLDAVRASPGVAVASVALALGEPEAVVALHARELNRTGLLRVSAGKLYAADEMEVAVRVEA